MSHFAKSFIAMDEFVWISPGWFLMGSPETEAN